ncbi:MAG TPA: protoporphyrinogen oxidase HemJ [Tahibacter sp.]|uniref:protoporphyrinogen oxidase HemJ n=1 Tax=Tahibacter sp. TaxID=2056211 RepID=UPI002CCC7EA1|nr:protoporphyrinogen oxidase HemJ [Tahibacter sp.]HSX61927.1 protoporphyrinogen oxidase HemJ [Tahibacter sp.]
MLWFKAFHIVSVVMWFAGLFYLPRLFVYHAEATEPVVRERLKVMERRLLVMTRIGGGLTFIFGAATLAWWMIHVPGYLKANPWLHVKLVLVFLLYSYHGYLGRLTREFAEDRCTRSPRWLRIFNELPALLLIGIVILVVVQPFKG